MADEIPELECPTCGVPLTEPVPQITDEMVERAARVLCGISDDVELHPTAGARDRARRLLAAAFNQEGSR